jgi:hypothetical protein
VTGLSGYDFKVFRYSLPYWTGPNPYTDRLVNDRYALTFNLPNGMWAHKMYGSFRTEGRRWEHGVLGHPKPEVFDLGYEHQGYSYTLLFSTAPFVVIEPTVYDEDLQPQGAYLQRARQIHKDELGQFVDTELPLVAREVRTKGNNRSRKRGDGWVRLVEAADMANMTPENFVLDHWLFVDATDRRGCVKQFKDVEIDILLADVREEIHKQVVGSDKRRSLTKHKFEELCMSDEVDWSIFWIRRGFARTVLLLQRYGWNNSREEHLLATR